MESKDATLRWMHRELERAGVEAGIDVEDGQIFGTYFSIVCEEPGWSPEPVYSVYPNDASEFDTSVAIRGGDSISAQEAVALTVKRFGPPPGTRRAARDTRTESGIADPRYSLACGRCGRMVHVDDMIPPYCDAPASVCPECWEKMNPHDGRSARFHAQTLGSLMDGQDDEFAMLLRPIRDYLLSQALVREIRDAVVLCGIDYIEADSFADLHDLCDANEFLMDAWRAVFDSELDAGDESHCAIINRAVDAYDARYGSK